MSNNILFENFIKYGIDEDLSKKLVDFDLTVSKCKALSQNDLKNKYKLNENEISIVKTSTKRQPIDKKVVDTLLKNSNYICNVCKGEKSHSFIIHHIEEYEKSQDNSYNNLIVLCPSDHDLAHKQGVSLTNKISKSQLRKLKTEWEEEVRKKNEIKASENINIRDEVVDFVNIQRLEELVLLTFKRIPDTYVTPSLKNKKILNNDGFFDEEYVRKNLSSSPMLFSYINAGEGIHYLELLRKIVKKKNFIDIRSFFKIRSINKKQINGQYVFFTGGFYSRSVGLPLKGNEPLVVFHYKKQNIRIECKIDSQYALSQSALGRLGVKTVYSIYGVVKNTFKDKDNIWVISISPYIIGFPEEYSRISPFYSNYEFDEEPFFEDIVLENSSFDIDEWLQEIKENS